MTDVYFLSIVRYYYINDQYYPSLYSVDVNLKGF